MPETFARPLLASLDPHVPGDAPVCVGFSGGLDSTVLLDRLAEEGEAAGRRITALHVHHGLSPHADRWVRSCERFCANHGVPLSVEYVRVDAASPEGLEGAARAARYAVFAARPEPVIALAHHLDDQAETVLLQLLRGTGLRGIAAMPALRLLRGTPVRLWRPLLEIPRAALVDRARARGLHWIEDESNESDRFDRNFLRRRIAPLLDGRFEAWQESLGRFARHAGAAGELLDQLATVDGVPSLPGVPFPLDPALAPERRANALRAFLARNFVAMPSEARLAEMARQLYEAREDAQVRIEHAGVSVVRFQGAARIERGLVRPVAGGEPAAWRVPWRREAEVDLGPERGSVRFDAAPGQGIAAAHSEAGDWYFAGRAGGETLRLGADRPTRTLRNLLQEREVPLWQREKLPLLFHDGRLVWVPGIGIAAEYACARGEAGVVPSWRVAGNPPLC